MNLFELVTTSPPAADGGVPSWTVGCFRRQSISFFNGAIDSQTEVIWLQTRRLTADLRLPAERPGCSSLERATAAQLIALAAAEGGMARTRWDGSRMHWEDWVSLQTHAKWPEPGELRRVGRSLIEFAPSGAYVEEWRLQPSAPGPLIGLTLIEELDRDQRRVLHRGGGLVVCGDHAALVRGRPEALQLEGRLSELVRAHADDAAAIARLFACDAAYASREIQRGDYVVRSATLPWRVGSALASFDGFSWNPDGTLGQLTVEQGRAIERRYAIDTLEPRFDFEASTPASEAAQTWLCDEPGLLASAR